MTLTPAQIIERLETIERDLAERQLKGETSAENYHRAIRDYELAYARKFVEMDGTVTEKKHRALAALASSPEYFALKESEGAYEGWKAALRTFETRTSIGQSLLRAHREAI